MATQAMSNIDYALQQNETYVGERITAGDSHAMMALFKKAKNVKPMGRRLIAYFNSVTRTRGGSGFIAENGDLPGGGVPATQQNYVTAQLGVLTVEYSDHEIQAMEMEPSHANAQKVSKDLMNEVRRERDRIAGLFASRDDGVLARADAAVTTDVKMYSSIPIRAVVGDDVACFPQASSTGDERSFDGTDEFSTIYINAIEYDEVATDTGYAGSITLSGTESISDRAVIRRVGHATGTNIYGLEAHFDTVNDTNFSGYDGDDDSTYDHVDTYAGLARSTYSNLNVGTIYANSANLSYNMLTRAAQRCQTQAGRAVGKRLFALMTPLQYDRFCIAQEGKAPRSENLKISGMDFTLPVLTFGGASRMPVITSPLFNDGNVLVVPSGILYKVFRAVGWYNKAGLMRQTAASGSGYAAKATNSWRYFLNTYCDMPFMATLIHGLSVANA
jgi:hypothetical protein